MCTFEIWSWKLTHIKSFSGQSSRDNLAAPDIQMGVSFKLLGNPIIFSRLPHLTKVVRNCRNPRNHGKYLPTRNHLSITMPQILTLPPQLQRHISSKHWRQPQARCSWMALVMVGTDVSVDSTSFSCSPPTKNNYQVSWSILGADQIYNQPLNTCIRRCTVICDTIT